MSFVTQQRSFSSWNSDFESLADGFDLLDTPREIHEELSTNSTAPLCDKDTPGPPTRGDIAQDSCSNFRPEGQERLAPHETVDCNGSQHELAYVHSHTCFQHRSYEPQVFRLSGSAPTPVWTAPLLNKGRDAISPRLPQCHHPYILPSRWFLPSPVSPAVGCATPPFSHTKMNYPPINHQNQAISKPDSVRDGTMNTNDISLLQFHGTNQQYIDDLNAAASSYQIAYGYYNGESDTPVTQGSSSSSHLSSPRLCSPWRASSSSPSSMSDELATPGAEYTKYSDMFSSATLYSAAVQDAWVDRSERDGLSLPVHSARVEYSLEEPQWHQSPLNVSNNYQQSLECNSVSQWLSQIQKQTPPASMPSETSGSRHTPQALPPSVFTQSSLTTVKLPDLQHPRPRRAYVPSWQKETEFDVRQFVSSNPGPGSSVCDALPIIEDGVSEASEEDYMDEEWEWDDDNEEDEAMEDVPVDVAYGGSSQSSSWTAHASFRGDEVRQNTSFNSGSRTSLDSTSLLFQPVSDSVRYPQPCVIPESATYDGPFHPYYLGSVL